MSHLSDKRIILIPIDFTEITLVALDQALNLSKVIKAKITLINVIEDHGFFNKYISSKEQSDYKKSTEAKLNELAKKKTKESGIEINTVIAKGKIYDKINEVADMIGATLILMGTSGSMGLMKFIGSNTLRVIRESKVPVISIKGKEIKKGLDAILLPLDFTKETKEKVSKAIWLSKLYGNAPVEVVSICTTKDSFLTKKIKRQEQQVVDFLRQKGIKCNGEIISNLGGKTLAQTILDYAKKVNAGVIMIMTQQETDITEMFIGSAAQGIINNSEIPVMSVVPAPKKGTSIIGS